MLSLRAPAASARRRRATAHLAAGGAHSSSSTVATRALALGRWARESGDIAVCDRQPRCCALPTSCGEAVCGPAASGPRGAACSVSGLRPTPLQYKHRAVAHRCSMPFLRSPASCCARRGDASQAIVLAPVSEAFNCMSMVWCATMKSDRPSKLQCVVAGKGAMPPPCLSLAAATLQVGR